MTSKSLISSLEHDEGVRRFPYYDVKGKETIGIGRNLTDRGLSKDEVYYLLTNDINIAIGDLTDSYPWFASLDSVRREVLINMCFNLGIIKLSTFKQTLSAIQSGNYSLAHDCMLESLWAKQVGDRATRLATEMKTGVSSWV